ncbi:MAG: tetratricopeptide repeat protein [Acidobacteria bacterium]|nr:tetratricopeptide repeat protein [Acidobacteriota bacterium]
MLSRADQLIKEGRGEEALSILRAAVARDPADSIVCIRLGKAFYQLKKYQETITALTSCRMTVAKDNVTYREVIQMLGLSHYILGHVAESIPFFQQSIEWFPDNLEIAYALGVSYVQTRQPGESRKIYARLFGVAPDSAAAYLINAQMHIRQRFEETAEVELLQALKLDARLPQANFHLGEIAIYKADIEKGITTFQKEISVNPSNAMAYYRLGEALTRQLKWDQAIQPLQKSIWLNPYFSGPYIVLGKVYLKKGDLKNSEAMLRRSIAMDPNNFGAHHLLAQTLQQDGRIDEAKKEFALAEQLRAGGERNP